MFKPPQPPRYIINTFVENKKGKTDKYPVDPISKNVINAHDPLNWMEYKTAIEHLKKLGDGYSLGFVFIPEDNYFFIDLDNCLLETNEWSPLAISLCHQFEGSYIEVSNSGRGLHIIGKYEGILPEHSCKNIELGIEVYTSGRFCALTEKSAMGDSEVIKTPIFNQFLQTYGFLKPISTVSREEWITESMEGCNPPDDNNEIIRIIRAMPKGASEVFQGKKHADFNDLFDNNESELAKFYPSQSGDTYDRSSADSALAYRLHYFLGGNCQRVFEIMEMSKLKREKWSRSDYLPRTIVSARGKQNKCFGHHNQRNDRIQPPQSQQTLRILQKSHYPFLNETFTKPLDIADNLKFLLDQLGIIVRWNDMRRIREVKIPNIKMFSDDEENNALRVIKDICTLNGFPIVRIDEHLDEIAQKNNYHPIVEALINNPWDGVPRLNDFIATLKTENDALSYLLIKRWMMSAVAAAFTEKGFSSHGILVLVGDQSLGKTGWLKALDPLDCEAVREGGFLDPTNKDCIITFSSHWIIELGELDGTLRKTDIARLKSHITSAVDVVRRPFGRKDSRFARRTVYSASVNDSRFLTDVTGNRRFWTIPVTEVNFKHGLDMLQVWAEVYKLWKLEGRTWLDKEEEQQLNRMNKNHEQIDPFEDKLYSFYDFSKGWQKRETEKKTCTSVLNSLGYQNVTRSDATRMAHILKRITGKEPHRRHHTLPKYVPPKIT